jgi:hypothetical protein
MDNSFDNFNDENSINIWNNNQDLLNLIEQHYERKYLLRQTMVSPVTITMPNYPTSNKEDSEIASQIDIRTDQKFGNTLQLYNFLIFRETTLSSIAKEIANI